MRLSNSIWKVSREHRIPSKLYTAILMQESSYKLAAKNCIRGYEEKSEELVKVCSDFGIAQVHADTIELYEFDRYLLLEDLDYSVEAGAKVLAWFQKTYRKKEPETWYCRYNTGTASYYKIKTNCLDYVRLVTRWM